MMKRITSVYLFLWGMTIGAMAADDIVIADFEGDDFGAWQVEGDAFEHPVEGSYPGQKPVQGIEGKRFVNSFPKGDRSQGTLTSPPFNIERNYISFKIGGGDYKGQTCVDLLIDNTVVRSEVGKRDETLRWRVWNVSDVRGKTATLRIVDAATSGWGHINVDHIVQSDVPKGLPPEQRQRTVVLNRKYLQFPINDDKPSVWATITVGGTVVHKFQIKLAFDLEPQWWAYLDVEEYAGQEASINIEEGEGGEWGLNRVTVDDALKGSENLYNETLRPQLRFSQKRGWNNDPNGMVYYRGEWHLYWQYGPFARNWNNMYWGHAVSKDLVHWEELPHAMRPYVQAAGNAFSGSAAVDDYNTGGFQTGDEPPIVAAFTDTGQSEVIAYSNDRGRTFTLYEGNPIFKHRGRDPKLFWYASSPEGYAASGSPGHWVIAVYQEVRVEGQEKPLQTVAFYTSTNLRDWDRQSHTEGFYECPEIFELPVDPVLSPARNNAGRTGEKAKTKWVMFGADGKYVIGSFDGKSFTPDHEGKHRVHYGAFYASQCFNGSPDGRVIQIGWARVNMPGMPFNQTFTLPVNLTLRTTEEGVRMFAEPVEEIKRLRLEPIETELRAMAPNEVAEIPLNMDIFELEMEVDAGDGQNMTLQFGDDRIDCGGGKLNGAPISTQEGRVKIRLLVDRPMYELIGNDGECYITSGRRTRNPKVDALVLRNGAKPLKIHALTIFPLKSIWSGRH